MTLKEVTIHDYKSIYNITFEFQSYGKGAQKSSTAFLLGINESGKSNLLNAIHALENGFEGFYGDTCNKQAQDEQRPVMIYGNYELSDEEKQEIKSLLVSDEDIPDELAANTELVNINRERLLEYDDSKHDTFSMSIETPNLGNYSIDSTDEIILSSDVDQEESENWSTLELTKYKGIVRGVVNDYLIEQYPEITIWKSDPSYLITEQIPLSSFSSNQSLSIPLQNMFFIFGKTDSESISHTIDEALKSPEKKAELVDRMSSSITKHVNKIWKEHKINFKFSIDGDLLNIVVEDKMKEYTYYNMKQRSEGFKQFVSLILSLSAKNSGDLLTNNIILIDEPENHLHPSGIQYMRKELLKIGKKNHLLISTHSNFMVDTTTMDRHWIAEKEIFTEIFQIDEEKSLYDEEVVSRAFGVEIMKELIPKNVILVEGLCDKIVMELGLKHFSEKINYSVKSAGGCSKVYSIASIMAAENFNPIVFLDSDNEGVAAKRNILTNLKENYSGDSVKTITDLGFTGLAKASIEDLYPREFTKNLILSKYSIDIDNHPSKPVVEAIKILDESIKNNKDKQTKIKKELSEAFKDQYNNKAKLESESPDLVAVINEFISFLTTE